MKLSKSDSYLRSRLEGALSYRHYGYFGLQELTPGTRLKQLRMRTVLKAGGTPAEPLPAGHSRASVRELSVFGP